MLLRFLPSQIVGTRNALLGVMENLNAVVRRLFILGALLSLLLTAACSEVDFTEVASVSKESEIEPAPAEPPPEVSEQDVFVQRASDTPVDIIVVVDDSPSMSKERKKLGERIGSFINSLNGVDWRIAVTTTDVSDDGPQGSFVDIEGTTSKVLTQAVPNYKEKFLATVEKKRSASSSEQPLAATILAAAKNSVENAGFFRSDASLSMIYISDEDEKSRGGSSATKPATVLSSVSALWPKKLFATYGIIVEPGDEDCLNQGGSVAKHYYGTHVSELSRLTGGLTGSLCADDYGPTLSAIGQKVRKLNDTFELKSAPEAGSVVIELAPAQDIKWSMDGKMVTFDVPPMDNTKITVKYKKIK